MINLVSKEQPTPIIGTKDTELKYSLHIQYAGTVSTKEVVAFACKHTGMQSTAMKAALDSCCQTIELFLSMGYRVQLGELGTFFTTTDSTTVYSNVDAGLSQLNRLRVRFDANKELKQAVNNAEKRLVAIQRLVDPEKKIYETISTNQLTDGGSAGGSGGNSDSGGGNSDSGGGDLVG
jgi:predicted histone-like DNA-binding protein